MGAHVIGHGDDLVGVERRRGAVGGEVAEDRAGAESPAVDPLQVHAGDTAGRDQGPLSAEGFEKHLLVVRPIQPLDDQFAVREQGPAIVGLDALGAGHEAQFRPDAAQVLGQGLDLEPADLVREIELAVQVGGLAVFDIKLVKIQLIRKIVASSRNGLGVSPKKPIMVLAIVNPAPLSRNAVANANVPPNKKTT